MKISIISPAGFADYKKESQGLAFLNSLGYEVIMPGIRLEPEMWTAGDARQRAKQLEDAWCQESLDIIFAARGGFGCIHLLEWLDWARMSQYKKILCGHSDLSILHLAFLKKGLQSTVSGVMPAVELAEKEVDNLTKNSLLASLSFQLPNIDAVIQQATIIKKGSCQGRLIPVTLSVLCSLLGTDYFPDLSGDVLVLEDVNEKPYRLDAYLSQLQLCGVLNGVGGLIFADFSNCGNQKELTYLFEKFSLFVEGPVISGLPFGHCLPRLSLPVGLEVEFRVEEKITMKSLLQTF